MGDLSLNPNFLRTAGAQTITRNENGEFLYEYSAEVDPTDEAYRAFFLNIQFYGHDNLGWLEFTSELQFADENPDAFEDCVGKGCKGTLI